MLGATGASIVEALGATFELAIDAAAGRVDASPGAVLEASLARVAAAVAPLLAVLVVVGTLASVAQVGPLFAPRALAFSPERLDPVAGARRLVSGARAVELLKALAIMVIVVAVAIVTMRDGLRGTLALGGRGALPTLEAAGTLVRALLLRTGGALLVVAVLDVLYQRWRWLRELRMTRREVEREHAAAEGSAHTRRERARVRDELRSHGALEGARHATLLVVSPGRLAVALRFDREREDTVPEVIAKGRDALAQRMVAVAREASVPIEEDDSVARALHDLAIGREIPASLYQAVAVALHGSETTTI